MTMEYDDGQHITTLKVALGLRGKGRRAGNLPPSDSLSEGLASVELSLGVMFTGIQWLFAAVVLPFEKHFATLFTTLLRRFM